MTIRIVLATRNEHKVDEVRRILAEAEQDTTAAIDVIPATQFPDAPEVVEDGSTFAANAALKAVALAEFTGLPAIADDSGLCVDALNGMPGIFSARWSGRQGDPGRDLANLELVLAQTADVPDSRRGASFHCAVALALPDGQVRVVEGRVDGRLIREPRGQQGFGYDPIFIADGSDRTTAQLAPAEKDAISHRGRAIRALLPVLQDVLGQP